MGMDFRRKIYLSIWIAETTVSDLWVLIDEIRLLNSSFGSDFMRSFITLMITFVSWDTILFTLSTNDDSEDFCRVVIS